jgi:type II secretory pathway pseudopilin PulG
MLKFFLYAAVAGAIIMVLEKIFATTVGIMGLIFLVAGLAILFFTIRSHRESLELEEDDEVSFSESIPEFKKLRYPIFLTVAGALSIALGIMKNERQEAKLASEKKEFEAMAQSYIDAAIKENCKYASSRANTAQLNSTYGDIQTRALGENAMLHTSPGVYQRAGDLSEQAKKEYRAALSEESNCESEQRTQVYARLRQGEGKK